MPSPPVSPIPGPGLRATADRPDERSGPLYHVVYVLPSDAIDRQLDTNGAIRDSVDAAQRFMKSAGGLQLRMDTYQGSLDISYLRLGFTDQEAAASGPYVREVIENGLKLAGFNDPSKRLLAYYEGTNTTACGSGAWPPIIPGTVAALYLEGEPPGFSCNTLSLAGRGEDAGYWEHSLDHEALHLAGFAPQCSPHHVFAGHVSDSPADLMYTGPLEWKPTTIDVGRDDYFKASVPGCPDLQNSPYVEPAR